MQLAHREGEVPRPDAQARAVDAACPRRERRREGAWMARRRRPGRGGLRAACGDGEAPRSRCGRGPACPDVGPSPRAGRAGGSRPERRRRRGARGPGRRAGLRMRRRGPARAPGVGVAAPAGPEGGAARRCRRRAPARSGSAATPADPRCPARGPGRRPTRGVAGLAGSCAVCESDYQSLAGGGDDRLRVQGCVGPHDPPARRVGAHDRARGGAGLRGGHGLRVVRAGVAASARAATGGLPPRLRPGGLRSAGLKAAFMQASGGFSDMLGGSRRGVHVPLRAQQRRHRGPQ